MEMASELIRNLPGFLHCEIPAAFINGRNFSMGGQGKYQSYTVRICSMERDLFFFLGTDKRIVKLEPSRPGEPVVFYEYFTAIARMAIWCYANNHCLSIKTSISIMKFYDLRFSLEAEKDVWIIALSFFFKSLCIETYAPFNAFRGSSICNPTFISSISWHINHHASPSYWCPSSILCQSTVFSLVRFDRNCVFFILVWCLLCVVSQLNRAMSTHASRYPSF